MIANSNPITEISATPVKIAAMGPMEPNALQVQTLSLTLQSNAILHALSFAMPRQGITTLIGPSGAGKSSLLRCINGLQTGWTGNIHINGQDSQDWPGGEDALRRHIGLIAQKPCVFPQSIHNNVTFGLQGYQQRRQSHQLVRRCLQQAALWDEVKDRLDSPAQQLSIGQQQRLCIARALAIKPRLLLLDEPSASLDPQSKKLIEDSLKLLSKSLPILCVTHDLDQARRLGEEPHGQIIFMCEGRIIEQGDSTAFFNHPQRLQSREYIQWNACDCTTLHK